MVMSDDLEPDLRLDRRRGLPEALRVLLRELPRADWPDHPNFHGMVSFWLDRHLMFRRLQAQLRADAQALAEGAMDRDTYAPRLGRFGGLLIQELHGHHQIEDRHYFPRLVQIEPRIARGFALLEQDHDAMDPMLHALAETANAVLRGAPAEGLASHLDQFGTLLDRHLTDEEEIIVPVLLKSGFAG